jgi:ubiquinone/menaquinone biosynthesis C-methylase UbiE
MESTFFLKIKKLEKKNDVYYHSRPDLSLSDSYLVVREKENRMLEDEVVKTLPNMSKQSPYCAEWNKRKDTLQRFEKYLKNKNTERIVEIGCGNGWFTNFLSNHCKEAIGQDINCTELEQASRIFKKSNLAFVYSSDIVSLLQDQKVDLIIFNASIQYFEKVEMLLAQLKKSLHKQGEIHVLDSFIYKNKNDAMAAKERSGNYYKEIGVREMSDKYFHHTIEQFDGFEIKYQPSAFFLKKVIQPHASPFSWLVFKNT